MIINRQGRVVVSIGERVEIDGVEYRCEAFEMADATDLCCSHCDFENNSFFCKILECFLEERLDKKDVVFVRQEGGEDERK